MIAVELRARARSILYGDGRGPDAVTLDEARRFHAGAVELRDEEATALWARVIWRILVSDRDHYDWLRAPVRPDANFARPYAALAEKVLAARTDAELAEAEVGVENAERARGKTGRARR